MNSNHIDSLERSIINFHLAKWSDRYHFTQLETYMHIQDLTDHAYPSVPRRTRDQIAAYQKENNYYPQIKRIN